MQKNQHLQSESITSALTLERLQQSSFEFSQDLSPVDLDLVVNYFKQLEESLLHCDFSLAENNLNYFLHPELFEISPQGEYTERSDIVNWLLTKSNCQRWQLCQFRVSVISPVDVLVCYQANSINGDAVKKTGTRRSSIWTKGSVKNSLISTTNHQFNSHNWQLRFHQATKN